MFFDNLICYLIFKINEKIYTLILTRPKVMTFRKGFAFVKGPSGARALITLNLPKASEEFGVILLNGVLFPE